MRIAIVCPSRGRPELAKKLVRSVLDTSEANIIFALDDDDPELRNYYGGGDIDEFLSTRVQFDVGRREPVTHKINNTIRKQPQYDVYGMLPDDAIMTTRGWDLYLIGVFTFQPMAVVSPHHNNHGEMDMPFVTKKWIDTMGFFAYPHCGHFCWPFVMGVIGHGCGAAIYPTEEEFHVQHDMQGAPNLEVYRDDAIGYFEHFALNYRSLIAKAKAAMA